MSVYVDDVRHPYGRMIMCHMWADTHEELLAMADRIGVARKWLQKPPHASWVHFDIALCKKSLALKNGAILTDRYGPLEYDCRRRIAMFSERIAKIEQEIADGADGAADSGDGVCRVGKLKTFRQALSRSEEKLVTISRIRESRKKPLPVGSDSSQQSMDL